MHATASRRQLQREVDFARIRVLSDRYVPDPEGHGRIHQALLAKLQELVAKHHPHMTFDQFVDRVRDLRRLEAELERAEDENLREELEDARQAAAARLEQVRSQVADLAEREQRGELTDDEIVDACEAEAMLGEAEKAYRQADIDVKQLRRESQLARPKQKQADELRQQLFGETINH